MDFIVRLLTATTQTRAAIAKNGNLPRDSLVSHLKKAYSLDMPVSKVENTDMFNLA
jgi:hypothetical protein